MEWLLLIGCGGVALFFAVILIEIVLKFSADERDAKFWAITGLLSAMSFFVGFGAIRIAAGLAGLHWFDGPTSDAVAFLVFCSGVAAFTAWGVWESLRSGTSAGRRSGSGYEIYRRSSQPISFWVTTVALAVMSAGSIAACIGILALLFGLLD